MMTIKTIHQGGAYPHFRMGYVPMMPTGFGQVYRGPVFEAPNDPTPNPTPNPTPPANPNPNPNPGPTDAEAKLLKELMEWKTKAQKAADDAAAAAKRYEGIDPDKVREMMAAQRQAEEDRLKAAGDFEALKVRMGEEHTKALKTERERLAAIEADKKKLEDQIRVLTVGTAFVSSKFLNEDTVLPPDIAQVAYDSYFDVVDGKVVGYDAPRGAAQRVAFVNASGAPLSFDEVLKRIVEASPNKDRVLKSKRVSGPGTNTSNDLPAGNPSNSNTNPTPFVPGSGLARIASAIPSLKIGQKK